MLFPQGYSFFLAFSLALAVFFPLLTSVTVCHAILDYLSSVKSLILLIWFYMYSACSFRYTLANSFCAFLGFRALVLVGFLLLHLEAVFTSAHFFQTANVSHGTLLLALCLVGVHSAASSKWALTKFSYLSFGVGVSDISCVSNLFLSVNAYLSSYAQSYLNRDDSVVGGHTLERKICLAIQCAIPFLIYKDAVYLCLSIICSVGP